MTSDNKSIGERLRAAHAEWAGSANLRSIRLPADTHLQFHDRGGEIAMVMRPSAVVENMQDNSAAFEGWSLALRLWLNVPSVVLYWSPPERASKDRLNLHYARFLYRIQRFQSFFADWFRVGTPEHLADCPVSGPTPLFLNVAGSVEREPAQPKRETLIERALVGEHQASFRKAFGLLKAARQFPVGLYETHDLKGPVFTTGTSAIDITGSDGETLTVFELKAGGNISVGALGELLFYTSVVRDAAGGQPRFQFGRGTNGRSSIGPDDVRSAEAVRGVLLAENFHPLLEHPALILTLNQAAGRQVEHPIPVSFEAWSLEFRDTAPPLFQPLSRAA